MKSLYSTFKGKKHVLGKGEQGGGLTPTEMFMKYNLKDIISDCFASQLPCNCVRYWMRKEKIATQNEFHYLEIQSTLVISKSKGPSKTVRDIRTSTYQICSIEEKTI